ncbi:MAG: hypothetical protein J0L62_06155 [Bacteroidetes bacterium]|nr:hypothetical protein [Bacteroidota bacterium]
MGLLINMVVLTGWVQDIRIGTAMISFSMWSFVWFFQDKKNEGLFFLPFSLYNLLFVLIYFPKYISPGIDDVYPFYRQIKTLYSLYFLFLLYPFFTFNISKMVFNSTAKKHNYLVWLSVFLTISGFLCIIFFRKEIVLPAFSILIDLSWMYLIFILLKTWSATHSNVKFNHLGIQMLIFLMILDDISLFLDAFDIRLSLPNSSNDKLYTFFYINQIPQLFILSFYFVDWKIRSRFVYRIQQGID